MMNKNRHEAIRSGSIRKGGSLFLFSPTYLTGLLQESDGTGENTFATLSSLEEEQD